MMCCQTTTVQRFAAAAHQVSALVLLTLVCEQLSALHPILLLYTILQEFCWLFAGSWMEFLLYGWINF